MTLFLLRPSKRLSCHSEGMLRQNGVLLDRQVCVFLLSLTPKTNLNIININAYETEFISETIHDAGIGDAGDKCGVGKLHWLHPGLY